MCPLSVGFPGHGKSISTPFRWTPPETVQTRLFVIRFAHGIGGGVMMRGQRGFWDVEARVQELSAVGDPLEKLSVMVDIELFRPVLTQALRRGDPSKGGRPGFDPVLKFKMLVLQALHGLSHKTSTPLNSRDVSYGVEVVDARLKVGHDAWGWEAGRWGAVGSRSVHGGEAGDRRGLYALWPEIASLRSQ